MSHKKLHILINKEDIVFYTIYPILINKNQFHELGYKIKFFFNVTKNFYDCDVLILISKPTKSISRKIYPFCKKDHHIEFLKNCSLFVLNQIEKNYKVRDQDWFFHLRELRQLTFQ